MIKDTSNPNYGQNGWQGGQGMTDIDRQIAELIKKIEQLEERLKLAEELLSKALKIDLIVSDDRGQWCVFCGEYADDFVNNADHPHREDCLWNIIHRYLNNENPQST